MTSWFCYDSLAVESDTLFKTFLLNKTIALVNNVILSIIMITNNTTNLLTSHIHLQIIKTIYVVMIR